MNFLKKRNSNNNPIIEDTEQHHGQNNVFSAVIGNNHNHVNPSAVNNGQNGSD
jgi:hypothetical protein